MIIDEQGRIITDPDLDEGHLEDKRIVATFRYHIDVEQQSHWETVKEYPNGGKDVKEVIDVEEVGHWQMFVDGEEKQWEFEIAEEMPHEVNFEDDYVYQLYILYTEEEKEQKEAEERAAAIAAEVKELKQKLADTDYITCKIVEGVATLDDYAELIAQREQWRERIRELEN